jgi:hypothetical protein
MSQRTFITRTGPGQFRVRYQGQEAMAADRRHAHEVAKQLRADFRAARAEYGI